MVCLWKKFYFHSIWNHLATAHTLLARWGDDGVLSLIFLLLWLRHAPWRYHWRPALWLATGRKNNAAALKIFGLPNTYSREGELHMGLRSGCFLFFKFLCCAKFRYDPLLFFWSSVACHFVVYHCCIQLCCLPVLLTLLYDSVVHHLFVQQCYAPLCGSIIMRQAVLSWMWHTSKLIFWVFIYFILIILSPVATVCNPGMQVDVIFGDQPYGLPLKEVLLPQYLAPLGYRSHIVGKVREAELWHAYFTAIFVCHQFWAIVYFCYFHIHLWQFLMPLFS